MPLKKLQKITKDDNLGKLIIKHPETVEVLLDFGLHCVGCVASAYDTVEEGCKVHGLSDKEISELVDRLNEVVNYQE